MFWKPERSLWTALQKISPTTRGLKKLISVSSRSAGILACGPPASLRAFFLFALMPEISSVSHIEGNIEALMRARVDSHVVSLLTELFMPRPDGVIAWWQALNRKRSVAITHREKRVRENPNIGLHPRMLIAFEWYRDLGMREPMRKRFTQ